MTYDLAVNSFKGQYGFQFTGAGVADSIVSYEYTILAPTVAIGNQWLIDNGIFFGIDWIGYSYPLVKKIKLNKSSIEYAKVNEMLQELNIDGPAKVIEDNILKDYGLFYLVARFGYKF